MIDRALPLEGYTSHRGLMTASKRNSVAGRRRRVVSHPLAVLAATRLAPGSSTRVDSNGAGGRRPPARDARMAALLIANLRVLSLPRNAVWLGYYERSGRHVVSVAGRAAARGLARARAPASGPLNQCLVSSSRVASVGRARARAAGPSRWRLSLDRPWLAVGFAESGRGRSESGGRVVRRRERQCLCR